MAADNVPCESEEWQNLAPGGSPESRCSLKRIKIRKGGGEEEACDRGESRAVIMKTGSVCSFNGKELGCSEALKSPMRAPIDKQDSNKNETWNLKNDGSEGGVAEKSTGSEALCPVCSKSFHSKKAMYGHMRCHPEREWRGINPPPSTKTASCSSVSQEINGLSHSPKTSTVVSSDTSPQPLLRWTKTGRRGQNHPLSSSSTWVSSSNISLTHKQGIKDKDQGIEEVSESLLVAPMMYKCSTCDKLYPTFQALGGHRSGHSYKNNFRAMDAGEEASKEGGSKVVVGGFKCNICSKTFPSGQALGGHKRSHFLGSTQATPSQNSASGKGSKSLGGKVLDFDLNELPPMEA